MKTKTIAGTAILAVLIAGAVAIAFANSAYASTPSNQATKSAASPLSWRAASQGQHGQAGHQRQHGAPEGNGGQAREQRRLNLTVGETLTFSNLTGRYMDATNRTIEGNASGAFTFTVTGTFHDGYTLSVASGAVQIGSTTYSAAPGTLVLGPTGEWATGSGSSANGPDFLISLAVHGVAGPNSNGRVVLDMNTGTTEYLVSLSTGQS